MFYIVLQVPQSELDLDTVKSILSEYRTHNAYMMPLVMI